MKYNVKESYPYCTVYDKTELNCPAFDRGYCNGTPCVPGGPKITTPINWEEKLREEIVEKLEAIQTNKVPEGTVPEGTVPEGAALNNEVSQATIPDSGKRRKFTTGSVRDNRDGKGRFDLLSPIALRRLALRMESGIITYGERNWEKGQPLMSYLDSAIRHIQDFIEDKMCSVDHIEDHMGAALWNIHSFIHTEEMIKRGCLPDELNDLPTPVNVLKMNLRGKVGI